MSRKKIDTYGDPEITINQIQLDPFKSNEERVFWQMGASVLEALDELSGFKVAELTYEAIRLQTPGGFYTLDFYVRMVGPNGVGLNILLEIKGSKLQRGYRETRQKLRDVASLYPGFTFAEVIIKPGGGLAFIQSIEFLSQPPFFRTSVLVQESLKGTKYG